MTTPANDHVPSPGATVRYACRGVLGEPLLGWSDGRFTIVSEHVHRHARLGWTPEQVRVLDRHEGSPEPIVTEVESDIANYATTLRWSDGARTYYAWLPYKCVDIGDGRALVEERFGKGMMVADAVIEDATIENFVIKDDVPGAGRSAVLEHLGRLADATRAERRAATLETANRMLQRSVERQVAEIGRLRAEVARLRGSPQVQATQPAAPPPTDERTAHFDPGPRAVRTDRNLW